MTEALRKELEAEFGTTVVICSGFTSSFAAQKWAGAFFVPFDPDRPFPNDTFPRMTVVIPGND